MITIKLYQFAKRTNSTKRPNDRTDTVQVFDGDIANATNMLSLTVIVDFTALKVGNAAYNPLPWTYAFIVELQRYYFVTNWTWANGVYYADLAVDVLATFRGDIYNSNLYVLRASKAFDGLVPDTLYPAVANVDHVTETKGTPWETSFDSANGTFLVATMSGDRRSTAGISYYVMGLSSFRTFMYNTFNSVDWLNIPASEISQSLQKVLFNPSQYVISVMWFPKILIGGGDTAPIDHVEVGWWTIPIDGGYKLQGNLWESGEQTITIPKHPQSKDRGAWCNLSPYSTYSLEFWPFGQIALDSSKLVGITTLKLSYVIDYLTGAATLRVTGNQTDSAIAITSARLGVPISLAHITYDLAQLSSPSTWIAAGGAALLQNDGLLQGIKNFFGASSREDAMAGLPKGINADEVPSAIGNAIGAVIGSCQTQGANGSTAQLGLAIRVNADFMLLAPDDNEHNGRPLCTKALLSTLAPGFVKCQSGDIEVNCPAAERNAINTFLTGGVYLE
jgi:hypothetical protein